ncbi:hypothetical protein EBT31_15800, partial [bacterium]|nr:hypothetical protein [bacterium]
MKRTQIGTSQIIFVCYIDGSNYSTFEFSGDQLRVSNTVGAVDKSALLTSQVFRDTNSWYHLVVAANSSSSLKMYVNGVEVTQFQVVIGPDATDWFYNSTNAHNIGRYSAGYYFSGYLADIHFIDGQALTPSSFGQTDATTGEWVPIAYTGTYGTNGFKLNFSNNSAATATTLGADSSGNGNNWTPNNLSVTAGAG